MDDSNDRCNWKKVFKKFLEPQKPAEIENVQEINTQRAISIESFMDPKICASESSLVSCSPASNDSGYSGSKFEFRGELPSEVNNVFETNLNIPQVCDYKLEWNREPHLNPSHDDELTFNISETNHFKTDFDKNLCSKKFPPHEFKMNPSQTNGCNLDSSYKLPSKILSHELNTDISHGEIPEWNKAFKKILSDNTSVVDVPSQKDTCVPKKTGNFKNSDTSGTFQRKQSKHMPKRRHEKAEKYKDHETIEAERKVKEIFALSRMFKYEQININDFHGCGVDIFKHEQSSSFKSTYGIDKPYLPLTGFIAKSKPYTAADVAASYVPFDEDAWDDDLLI